MYEGEESRGGGRWREGGREVRGIGDTRGHAEGAGGICDLMCGIGRGRMCIMYTRTEVVYAQSQAPHRSARALVNF